MLFKSPRGQWVNLIVWLAAGANNLATGTNMEKLLHYIRDSSTHYSDVIKGAIASQITSPTTAYSTIYLGADQRKHQSSASRAFVREFTGEFPAWMASNAENVSIWWSHQELIGSVVTGGFVSSKRQRSMLKAVIYKLLRLSWQKQSTRRPFRFKTYSVGHMIQCAVKYEGLTHCPLGDVAVISNM